MGTRLLGQSPKKWSRRHPDPATEACRPTFPNASSLSARTASVICSGVLVWTASVLPPNTHLTEILVRGPWRSTGPEAKHCRSEATFRR